MRTSGPDDPSKTSPAWGAALAVDDDWLYLYGTANPEQSFVFGFSLQVARVRPDEVLDGAVALLGRQRVAEGPRPGGRADPGTGWCVADVQRVPPG